MKIRWALVLGFGSIISMVVLMLQTMRTDFIGGLSYLVPISLMGLATVLVDSVAQRQKEAEV